MKELKQELEVDTHRVPLPELCKRFSTNVATGLTPDQARRNIEQYGPNTLTPPPSTPQWVIFCRLVIPLSKPALATCALFAFLGTWNDFLGPLLYLSDSSKYTLAYGLQQFVNNPYVNWMQLMAASTLVTLPLILLFFFAQKTFIQGISTTGVK